MAEYLRVDAMGARDGNGQPPRGGQVKRGRRRPVASWAPTGGGLNPAGLEQLRELLELVALLLECTASSSPASATVERGFENTGAAIGQLRERAKSLAQILRIKSRLVKSD